jgi:hypothetical protein
MTYELHIRRGVLVNTDPQRRCYNGCYFSSRMDWEDWEHWMDYPDLESAQRAKRLFQRGDQELKIVPKETDLATEPI